MKHLDQANSKLNCTEFPKNQCGGKSKLTEHILFRKLIYHSSPLLEKLCREALEEEWDALSAKAEECSTAPSGCTEENKLLGLCSKAKNSENHKAFGALLELPNLIPNTQAMMQVFLLCLLSMLSEYVYTAIPALPIVVLTGVSNAPLVLETIIQMFVPLRKWHNARGKKVIRPYILKPVIKLGQTSPSVSKEDYFPKLIRHSDDEKGKLAYLVGPIIAVDTIPSTIIDVLITAHLCLPILCGKWTRKIPSRQKIMMDGALFQSFDPDILRTIQKYIRLIQSELLHFLQSCRQKKQRKKLISLMESFFPSAQNGRFIKVIDTDPTVRIWSMALSCLRSLLKFAKKQHWIRKKEANDFFCLAWAAVLPESAPNSPVSMPDVNVPACWDSKTIFYTFLESYVNANLNHISSAGKNLIVDADTVALVKQLSDLSYLIFPRFALANAYKAYIIERDGVVPDNPDRRLNHLLRDEWGIRIKTENNNISWRYTFYSKGCAPESRKEKLECIGFPIEELPDEIQRMLENIASTNSNTDVSIGETELSVCDAEKDNTLR